MNSLDILELLEKTSSTKAKQQILEDNKTNSELQELVFYSLNYKFKFYVNKFSDVYTDSPTASHKDFISLANDLKSRTKTGHAALNAIEDLFSRCSKQQVKWYSRVLRRDLKAGFGVDQANKVGWNIPQFEVMLAKDGKEYKKLAQMLKGKCYGSPKLDGYRCFAVIDGVNNNVTLYTRNGEVFKNFQSIEKSLGDTFFDTGLQLIFDGEVMSDNFNSIQKSAFASKRGTTVGDVKYHVFDYVPYDEYASNLFEMNTEDRLIQLSLHIDMVFKKGITNIVKVEQKLITTEEEIRDQEIAYLAFGYEGLMLKPNIPYHMGKKTGTMLKFKTMKSMDCVVQGCYVGERDTRHANSLGGLYLLQEDGQTKCSVGSGFPDDDRDVIWSDQSAVLGRIAEIKYQELTPDGVMRFPVFMRWRDQGSSKI